MQRRPEHAQALLESRSHAVQQDVSAALAGIELHDEVLLMQRLRELRNQEMARIAARALSAVAEPAETLEEVSALAQACCAAVVDWCFQRLCERHGRPRDEQGRESLPLVLGMGKLGGGELNFSSDIDLIFLHSADGCTDGDKVMENERFFVRLAQDVGKILATPTEHGFVFRVDTMLRPFGSAGPMSISFDAAEDYYQNHGREWERYALIKARPVAGDLKLGSELLQRLRPFVYRRYLDFNAIGSLRELKRRIHDDVVARRVVDDVKLGPGGIRELEFIVQSFQLVRGGQDSRLRSSALRPTLAYLGEAGLLPATTVAQLDQGYLFLRRLENAVQMYEDRQTHRLPVEEDARRALCIGMQCDNWEQLRAQLDSITGLVNEEFRRVFAEPERAGEERATAVVVRAIFDPQRDAGQLRSLLAGCGFDPDSGGLAQCLLDLAQGRLVRGLSESATQTLRRVLTEVLNDALSSGAPNRTAERVLRVVQAVAGRSTYLTLLDESAVVRAQLVKLCAASQWITEQIAASPAVLDALLDPRSLYEPPGRDAMKSELAARLSEVAVDDVESGMDVLRRYRNEITVRIAAADIGGSLPLVKVSDHLTWLAEAVLGAAMERARRELEVQYGRVNKEDGQPAGLGAVAYGKFGGIELGYGSDLDLVFVYEDISMEVESSGGARALPAPAWFARLSQRVIHWLTTLTPAGRAYEVDLELRPSGQSGPVAVSLQAFSQYQRDKAWTWEHQALTRARYVAGPEALGEGIEQLRREVLCRTRAPDKLAQEIVEMRQKMRRHLEKKPPGRWDVKQGQGGVIDCEFLTQYLVLRDAARHVGLVVWPDNWRQLDALAQAGSLSIEERDGLIASYRSYRNFAHLRALQSEEALADEGQFDSERGVVGAIWNRHLGPSQDAQSSQLRASESRLS